MIVDFWVVSAKAYVLLRFFPLLSSAMLQKLEKKKKKLSSFLSPMPQRKKKKTSFSGYYSVARYGTAMLNISFQTNIGSIVMAVALFLQLQLAPEYGRVKWRGGRYATKIVVNIVV